MDPDLVGVEFETFDRLLAVPAGATKLVSVTLEWARPASSSDATAYADNFQVIPVDETVDTTAPAAPVLASVTRPSNRRLRPNWSNTNSPADGVVGYNVYRRVNGQPLGSSVRLNTGLIDNPYIRYEDYTVQRGAFYRYHLTAVDALADHKQVAPVLV